MQNRLSAKADQQMGSQGEGPDDQQPRKSAENEIGQMVRHGYGV